MRLGRLRPALRDAAVPIELLVLLRRPSVWLSLSQPPPFVGRVLVRRRQPGRPCPTGLNVADVALAPFTFEATCVARTIKTFKFASEKSVPIRPRLRTRVLVAPFPCPLQAKTPVMLRLESQLLPVAPAAVAAVADDVPLNAARGKARQRRSSRRAGPTGAGGRPDNKKRLAFVPRPFRPGELLVPCLLPAKALALLPRPCCAWSARRPVSSFAPRPGLKSARPAAMVLVSLTGRPTPRLRLARPVTPQSQQQLILGLSFT